MYRGYPVTKSKYYPQAGLIARLQERGITYHPLPAEQENTTASITSQSGRYRRGYR